MNRLYHYTCGHGRQRIGSMGRLLPNGIPGVIPALVWLTDQDQPDREALGLTSTFIACDRLEHRYAIHPADARDSAVRWLDSPARAGMPPAAVADLEHGRDPELWYVAAVPVRAVVDLGYRPL